jgi:signal transduction histidine kinase
VTDPQGQRQLLDRLRPAVMTCQVVVPPDAAQQAAAPIGQQVEAAPVPVRPPERQIPGQPRESAPVPANPRYANADGDSVRVQQLSNDSWQQNRGANAIWNALKGQPADPAAPSPPPTRPMPPPGPAPAPGQVEIRSGPFEWQVMEIAGLGPSLVALRWVAWPDGRATQGLLIDRRRIDALCAAATLPARVVAQPPEGTESAPIAPLARAAGGAWVVAVDTAAAVAAADREADRVLGTFHRTFALGLSAALLAGLSVVALVWRTERLATERAQFAAAAAHELRTPLAGLRMYGEMLAEGLGDPQRRDQYARRVADEAERLGRVVANVLEFTRLERGTLRVQVAPHDLSQVVAVAVAKQQPALVAAGCAVETDLPAAPVVAACDPDAVTQIVQNLVDNAEKYSRGTPERRVRVAVVARDGRALVTVADNGPGVSARLQGRLFRAFVRGDDPDAPAGLGLGLALTRALARAQAGDVTHASAPGGGAAFTLGLPLAA